MALTAADYESNCRNTCRSRHEQCTRQCGNSRDEYCLARCPYRDENACRSMCPYQKDRSCVDRCDRSFNDNCVNECRRSSYPGTTTWESNGRKGGGFYIYFPVDYSEYVVDTCVRNCPTRQSKDCVRNCQYRGNRAECTKNCYYEPEPTCVLECQRKQDSRCTGCRDSRCRATCGGSVTTTRCYGGRCY